MLKIDGVTFNWRIEPLVVRPRPAGVSEHFGYLQIREGELGHWSVEARCTTGDMADVMSNLADRWLHYGSKLRLEFEWRGVLCKGSAFLSEYRELDATTGHFTFQGTDALSMEIKR